MTQEKIYRLSAQGRDEAGRELFFFSAKSLPAATEKATSPSAMDDDEFVLSQSVFTSSTLKPKQNNPRTRYLCAAVVLCFLLFNQHPPHTRTDCPLSLSLSLFWLCFFPVCDFSGSRHLRSSPRSASYSPVRTSRA